MTWRNDPRTGDDIATVGGGGGNPGMESSSLASDRRLLPPSFKDVVDVRLIPHILLHGKPLSLVVPWPLIILVVEDGVKLARFDENSAEEIVSEARQAAPCLQASRLLMNGSTSERELRDTAIMQIGNDSRSRLGDSLRGVRDSTELMSTSTTTFDDERSIALSSIILLLRSTMKATEAAVESTEKEGVNAAEADAVEAGTAVAR